MPTQRNRAKHKRPQTKKKVASQPDDFVSVARRLGCDEDKGRFEVKLRKIAKAKSQAKNA
jgi:hypothetical protein